MEANRYRGMRALLASFLVVFAILALAGAAFAQRETGSITGTITDPTGAVISGAQITLKNLNTNATRTATSSGTGAYSFTVLPPGPYEMAVQMAGFSPRKIQTTVTVGSANTVDAKLEMMTEKTTVEVFGQGAVEVETRSQEVSNVVNETQINTLPSLTRNAYDFVATVPNVQAGDQNTYERGVGVNINGQRSASTGILLDGGENVDEFTAVVGQNVPLDAVQEFRVITSDFGAEYGRATGGVVNVATKAGSNDFHGSAYEFNRLSAYTANTYVNSVTPDAATGQPFTPKPGYTRNQFGWSIGGPIAKNKLFFFNSVEFIRVRSQSAFLAFIPNANAIAFANGNNANVGSYFSQFGTLRPNAVVGAPVSYCDLFPDNCPADVPANVAAYGMFNPLFNNVTYTAPSDSGGGTPQNTYMIVGRVDYNWTDKTTLYGRYALYHENLFEGSINNSPYVGYDTLQNQMNQNALFNLTHIFSPNVVSQSKIVFNRLNLLQPLGEAPQGPTVYMNDTVAVKFFNKYVMFPGYSATTPGNAIPFGGPQNLAQFFEDVSWSKGKHQFKFGGQYIYTQDNRVFGAYETAVEVLKRGSVNNSTAIDNFLAGQAGMFQIAVDPKGKFPCPYAPDAVYGGITDGLVVTPDCTLTGPLGSPIFSRSNRYHDFAVYAQDTWKILPRLTLNLGLRWEYYGVQHNKNDNLDSNFYYGSKACPGFAAGCPGYAMPDMIANGFVATVPNSPIHGLWEPQHTNFGPRVGFAWDVFGDGKTSLRGGFGISYERNFGNVTYNVIQNPPAQANVQLRDIAFQDTNFGPYGVSGATFPLVPVSLRHVSQNIPTAYAEIWSLTAERQIHKDTVLSLGYSGSRGIHLYDIAAFNRSLSGCMYIGGPYSCEIPTRVRTNLQYAAVNTRGANAQSSYNALIASVRTNNLFDFGLSLNANYTWSHSIDNLTTTFSESLDNWNLGYMDPYNPGLDKGSGDNDARHRFVFSGIWDLPIARNTSNSILKQTLGGWTIAPIFIVRSGLPFTVWDCYNGFEICNRTVFDTTPQNTVMRDPINLGENSFNLLTLPPATPYADPILGLSDFGLCNAQPTTIFPCPYPADMSRRNYFVGPTNWNLNLSIAKNFKLTERFNLQFRSEFYNIFNHHNFYVDGNSAEDDGNPDPTPLTGVKGGFGTSLDERRYIQFALKLIF